MADCADRAVEKILDRNQAVPAVEMQDAQKLRAHRRPDEPEGTPE
jgi:hypothetical protein